MSKRIKIIVPIICFIIISIVVIVLCLIQPKTISVTTLKSPYNILSDIHTKDNLIVQIYVNQRDSFYTDINQINSATLFENDTMYRLSVSEIEQENQEANLYNQKYYLYDFTFRFDFDFVSEYQDELRNAKLELSYENGIISTLEIGSFSIYKYDNELTNNVSDLAITQSKTIIEMNKSNAQNSGFYGITLGIRNFNLENDLTIKKIEVLDGSVLDIPNMVLHEQNEFITNIIDLFPNYPNFQETENAILIPKNEMRLVSIPVVFDHSNDLDIGTFGLRIEYEILDKGVKQIKTYYLPKFTFYDSIVHISEDQLIFYQYDQK